jgi:dihydropteroate synthase
MTAKVPVGWNRNRSPAPETVAPATMTIESSDPGPGRGRLHSDGADPVLNPLGLLTGDAAARAVRAGAAQSLAGGPTAFTLVETLTPTPDGIERTIATVRDGSDVLSRLTAPRPAFAGIGLAHPVLMGVVNATPDSFSDGGDYFDCNAAIDRALKLADDGAAIVDIGGESTRPGAEPITVSDEIARIVPVIEAAVAAGITVSADTRHAAVMTAAIEAGAAIVNDITALTGDPASMEVVANSEASVVLMHMQGTPETMQQAPEYSLASVDIFRWLSARVEACVAAGLPRGRIVVDPGIGFGKNDDHNMEILDRAGMFHATGCAVAIGVSRKSFIGRIAEIADPKDRLPGTIAATLMALERGVQIHRVHDVAAVRQAIAVWAASAAEFPEDP